MPVTPSQTSSFAFDEIVFRPDDVDLARSPLRHGLQAETFALGAFNPGLTRLPNGNLLMMVRVAEALRAPLDGALVHAIRWTPQGFQREPFPSASVNLSDPRQIWFTAHHYKTLALTSLSWLLPVELSADGRGVVAVHYDKAIAPATACEEYGIEDPRISFVDGVWYMTVCAVSAPRLGTSLFVSRNGLDYTRAGLILDHQNKDVLIFEGKIAGRFHALTRPLGDVYFAYPEHSDYRAGPAIHLAQSPDGLHWRPLEEPCLHPRKASPCSRIGGGAPPVRTSRGWLTLYHGVETQGPVGIYRTFWAMLDADHPERVLHLADSAPLIEARPALTDAMADQRYLSDVVFTTGIAAHGDDYIVASGECDLACRITAIPRGLFA